MDIRHEALVAPRHVRLRAYRALVEARLADAYALTIATTHAMLARHGWVEVAPLTMYRPAVMVRG